MVKIRISAPLNRKSFDEPMLQLYSKSANEHFSYTLLNVISYKMKQGSLDLVFDAAKVVTCLLLLK